VIPTGALQLHRSQNPQHILEGHVSPVANVKGVHEAHQVHELLVGRAAVNAAEEVSHLGVMKEAVALAINQIPDL